VISGHKSWVKLKSYERIKASLFDDKGKIVAAKKEMTKRVI